MRVVQINATCDVGSTGKICVGISKLLTEHKIENYILYSSKSNGYSHGIQCSNNRYTKIQALQSRALGNYGFNSKKATRKMIAELERINPDIVHLHNIHGHDCDLETLFTYFNRNKMKLIWTFHDCWAFTGYCTYFDMENCEKWKSGCGKCSKKREYSWIFDKSAFLFERKKRLFGDLDLTIVTPSQWLADIVKQSFFKDYPVKVINNGIDLEVFKPTQSDFRKKYGIPNGKFIVLGVAFGWGVRKGLDVFIELSHRLPENQYKIVLVGTDRNVDKQLPPSILSIHRTQNQTELAEIYTAADVFVNPTREENYPTVNMEALACGTPVLTFKTGGSPEILDDTCGAVVDCGDVEALAREIERICNNRPYSREHCTHRALEFDKDKRFREYIELYDRVINAGDKENRI